jgi:hypothetical protein
MSNDHNKAPTSNPTPLGLDWITWPKQPHCDCMWKFAVNSYKTNKYGNDMLTELSLKLAHWKNENVFPVDLKLRAPAVLFSAMMFVKSKLTSVARIQQAAGRRRGLRRFGLGLRSRDHQPLLHLQVLLPLEQGTVPSKIGGVGNLITIVEFGFCLGKFFDEKCTGIFFSDQMFDLIN